MSLAKPFAVHGVRVLDDDPLTAYDARYRALLGGEELRPPSDDSVTVSVGIQDMGNEAERVSQGRVAPVTRPVTKTS